MNEFRHNFLKYEAIEAQLAAWQNAHGECVVREAIGQTPEGRTIWVLKIGTVPADRPAIVVDANMHACELAGSSVALAIAEQVIAIHTGNANSDVVSPELESLIKECLVYVIPRTSPDGAETVLNSGRFVRSVPRDTRQRGVPYWRPSDQNGDGLCLSMRREDATGEFVESPDVKGLMLPRKIDSTGPFYKLYPEGVIENWDGSTIPTPHYLSDNEPDLNRNFPYFWAPEDTQVGAGRFATSEPESRAIVEFAFAHPNIFAWLNLHTFGGVHIRPLGDKPDVKMNPNDLATYRLFERWADELTGYPTVSGFEEFTYEPETPLRGDLTDFVFHQRAAFTWVTELWDLFEQAKLPQRKRFVDRYTHFDDEELIQLAKWDKEKNNSRALRPWQAVEHPQLGPVEVGGLCARDGFWNPPLAKLPKICDAMTALFMRVAAMVPRVNVTATKVDGGIRVRVENTGYFATYVLASAAAQTWNEGVVVAIETDGEVVGAARKSIGHLEGWGRGRYGGGTALYAMASKGSVSTAEHVFHVKNATRARVVVSSPRIGRYEVSV